MVLVTVNSHSNIAGEIHGVGDEDAELDSLRNELADRLDERPFESWSPRVLRAVIAVLELVEPCPMAPEPGQRRLRLVR